MWPRNRDGIGAEAGDPVEQDHHESRPSASRARSVYTLLLLTATCLVAYVQWQVVALFAEPMRHELALSDGQLGALQGIALNLTMGLAAFPLGILIDRKNRMRLLAVCAIGWSGFTLLSGLSGNFWQLLVCRIGVGAAESGAYSTSFSLIADLFPQRARAHATSLFFGGFLIGTCALIFWSGPITGYIGQHTAALPWHLATLTPWRLAFIAVAIPGFVSAALLWTSAEPPRQRPLLQGGGLALEISFGPFVRQRRRILVAIVGSMFAAQITFQELLFWMPTILNRIYGVNMGRVGQIFGGIFGSAAIAGIAVSSLLIGVFSRRNAPLAALRVFTIGVVLPAFVFPFMLLAGSANAVIVIWFLNIFLVHIATPVGPVLISDVVPQHLRGQLFAYYNFTALLASAISIQVIGILSDSWHPSARGLLFACCAIGIPAGFLAPLLVINIRRHFLRSIDGVPGSGIS